MEDFKKLFSAFDYIDEVIYICDMDTYDLVYCNKKLEENMMAEYHADRSGYKCYQCLHGLDHPCVFCNNDSLRKDKRCIWTRKHPQTGKYFMIHDSVIAVDGKDYRLELAVDATHMEEAALRTRQKLNKETHLTDCVRNLVKAANFSDAVSAMLQTILNYFGGERAYIFEFNWEKGVARNTYEICAPGIPAEIDNLQAVPIEHMQRWIDIFNQNADVIIEDLEELKNDPSRQIEYKDLSIQGIRSLIVVPVILEDEIIGCIGVDNPSLNLGDSDFLNDLAYFLGVEIRKNDLVSELQDMSYHDPLTGVFNRKGFEEITDQLSSENIPFGFLMVDIDNFKMINDTYGHSVGDDILKETATLLTNVFRNDDTVFRLGGDEFAVLLNNCKPGAFNTICSKIQWIHTALAENYKKASVTLSAGVCFTSGKFSEFIYRLADQVMYNTKKSGRAGCTMIDEKTGEKKYWKDDTLSAYSRSVLNINSTGLYRIEYPFEKTFAPRMIVSNAVREMFAFPVDADAETCYRLWMAGIDQAYQDVLDDVSRQLLTSEQVEYTYQWNHPKYGPIFIRTNGISEMQEDKQVVYGYHHSMKDTQIIEKKDDSQLLLEAISSIYFGSYYVDLMRDSYSTIKNAPNEQFLHIEEGDAQKSLYDFVEKLARKSNYRKMKEFVDLSTLPMRMKNETHLDCEYYAVKEKKWCRATFIPVKYFADGNVSHVLFEVAPLDIEKSQEAEESAQNKKTIESLYNHVPGGLVMYEWDGKTIKTLHSSRYYAKIFGDLDPSQKGTGVIQPDFRRIHPDDVNEYKKEIDKALKETHHLEYAYRVWNNKKNAYVWIKINAVSEIQEDGTSLVYAMYSDVTAQKEAELQLEKKHASLAAAISAFNQLCYEYDPVTHREVCLTEDRVFHLPRLIEDYPESKLCFVHPEDKQTFLDTVHSMDHGKAEASCNIRLLRNGVYVWYAYQLQSLYDSELGRSIVSISIMDNSEHMATIENYQARMNIMMGLTEDSISFGTVNLTNNTFHVIRAGAEVQKVMEQVKTLDEFFTLASKAVVGNKEQEEYRERFCCKNLIEKMKQGRMNVHLDHMYRTAGHLEWVRTSVDMLQNPSSGDIVGVCYSKSIQNEKISSILLEKTLKQDYPLAAIVETKSDRYYLFDSEQNQYCIQKENFWKHAEEKIESTVEERSIPKVRHKLEKEHILSILNSGKHFSHSFNSQYSRKNQRMEVKFDYIDSNHEMILATLRDITDSVIMEQLIHDNERDHLTDLYNRRKAFAECEKLLDEHPEDQFAMLHFDIRHFRLYNTFFGDEAGDKLLCDIADMFRNMEKDYDYWAYGRIEADVFCVFFPINQNKYQKHLDDLLHGLKDYRPDFLIEPAIGIYIVTDRTMSIESMFTRASIAAKNVRSGVTNTIIFYDETMEQSLTDSQQVINDMQTAIEKEQFQVYLQPKYSLKTKKRVGAEALVRWIHPERGFVTPNKFIPIFERNGFIATLDRYMWEHVCILLRKWLDSGRKIMPVSVNVSRISMYSPTTVQFLKDLVNKYRLDPKYLELELTESAYMDDPMEMKKQLQELKNYGFHILMDDFGSGYSSLNTLRELPVNCLKLDKEFLSESTVDERGKIVLSLVVQMSKMLDLDIIAEGVETKEQADFLNGLGCEYVQGFLFAKPMPVGDYEKLEQE